MLSEQKESLISEMGGWDNGVWEWEFKWGRELSSRNLESFNSLLIFLNRNKPKQNGEDRWTWKHSSNGVYTVNKAYNVLLSKQASKHRSLVLQRGGIQETVEELGNKEGIDHGMEAHKGKDGDSGQLGKKRSKLQSFRKKLSTMQRGGGKHETYLLQLQGNLLYFE
ncbi:hypothetical protein ACS0TY_008242 [Phlomoides rotata]